MKLFNLKFNQFIQSILEYKTMNVEKQRRIFVEPGLTKYT